MQPDAPAPDLLTSTEKLLLELVQEASKADQEQTPLFADRLKVVATATSFLAMKAKIEPDEPPPISPFERLTNAVRSTPVRRARKTKEKPEGSGISEGGGTTHFDPLAPAGTDPFTISRSQPDLGAADIAGSAD